MSLDISFKKLLLIAAAGTLAACSQGSNIASPGVTNPGTPPGGTGGGGGGGGGGGAACPAGFTCAATPVAGRTVAVLSGAVLANLTIPAANGVAYRIDGRLDIGSDTGADGNAGGTAARLTIEPGAVLFGNSGADYIVVNRGSQIEANGTAANPIIMTSQADLLRQADTDPSNDDGGSNISEWGGLVILGRAPINRCRDAATPGTVQCENVVEGVTNPDALYGGASPNDNSGILRYVRVQFAGFAINTAGNELNGITFGGVGDGTTLENIQVHNNSDDGVEFFGGTANVGNLVLTGNDDDSVDTDNGYQGGIQNLIVVQRADGGDNIVEASSSAPGVTPLSNASISNFTFVGNRSNAFRLNTGTVGRYMNGVVDYGQECFRWQTSAGDGNPGYGGVNVDPSFDSVLFDCDGGIETGNSDPGVAAAAIAGGTNNVIGASSLAARLFPGPNEGNITPFDPTGVDGFLQNLGYAGAFGPADTETQNWAAGWTFALFPDPTCPTGTTDSGFQINGTTVCRISGVITDDIRLTRGNIYELDGRVDVGIDTGADGNAAGGDPASLTIESGVSIFGDSGADYLVVNRGSQLFSNGTAANPVIFTSENDITNAAGDRIDAISEWGGLVILGRAPINRCRDAATPGTVACENVVEGVTNPDALYGGATANDSSGSLTYTRVQFAGFAINTAGNELNGITFAGVGNGTTVNNIQVHNNSDDGVEFFGGGVNVRNLVLTGNDDDSIDTDNGYQGNIQFAIVVQRANGGDNVVEASSSAPGVVPLSNATVSNFTFVARAGGGNGFRLNTGTVGRYLNGVLNEQGDECFRFQSSAGNGTAGYQGIGVDPSFDSVLFDCAAGLETANSEAGLAAAAIAGGTNNVIGTNSLSGTFINGANETAVTAINPNTVDPWFTAATYAGAVQNNSDRWWAGWSCGLEATTPC
ncbi:beta strand repeat-containing protein [Hyphobacterium sp.]|uniref:beta strand repeat-containing protein n=1 Tax=Hyphobacterium sp. TaxID=2004662 RepID=UPI0037491EA7